MKLKLFDSFAGIGALHKALKNIGIDVELVGMSEIDIEALRAYYAIHYDYEKLKDIQIDVSLEEIKEYLNSIHIGYDFNEKRCKLPRNREKLIELYKICKQLNNIGDISLVKPKDLPDFDLFNLSFPCTDLSVAGQQKGLIDEDGNLTRSGLYVYGIEIIKAKKPKYVMIENVKNLVSQKFKPYFDNMIKELEEIGYNCYWQVLNAKDYGVPQNRERVFVICIRKDIDTKEYKFPKPFDNGLRLKDFLDKEVEEKYYISNEKVEQLLTQLKDGQKGHKPNNDLEVQITHALGSREHRHSGWKEECPTLCARDYKDPKVVSVVCEERTDEGLRFFKDNVCGTLRTIDACGDKRILEVMPCLTPDRINKRQNGRRFKEDGEPSFTLTTQDVHGVLLKENKCIQVCSLEGEKWDKMHESSKRVYSDEGCAPTIHTCGGGNTEPKVLTQCTIRKLTPIECYRLMGFKDEDIRKIRDIGMSDSQMYKQAGNSIVVNILEEIFKNLFKKEE